MTARQWIWKNHLHHVLFWSIVMLLWFYLRYQDYSSLTQAALITIIKTVDLAAVIYFANLVLVPRLLYRKKYLLFAIIFISTIALASFLKLLLTSVVLNDPGYVDFSNTKEKVYNNFVTLFFLVLASIALKSIVDYLQLQKELSEIAKEKAEAELNLLKSQINPHFLFNSLNAVYFLIDKQNTEARNALHRFSEMLRYQLYECNGSKIPVEKEISFLKDYVQLQKIRQNENCKVEFLCEDTMGGYTIEPLLLIPFVENSFKHLSNYSNGQQNQVRIQIQRIKDALHFSVSNTTEAAVSAGPKWGGIGLSNVRKRLELLYGRRHQLSITDSNGWFIIDLSLPLN